MGENKIKERLWNVNFFLLWQGQVVSDRGSVFYRIALGFWILDVTKSTVVMGTLMAVSSIPQVVFSPISGVIVDRVNRKWVIVLSDFINGILILFIAISVLGGFSKLWMFFVITFITGLCGSFFNPAVDSSLPDIVPKSKVVQANSAFSSAYSGSSILSNSIGGFIFQILGAPIMFLINGLSFIFSAFSEVFIKIPIIHHEHKGISFKQDMKESISFIWRMSGFKYLYLAILAFNFFAVIALTLILPLFQRTIHLGAGMYGLTIGGLAIGQFTGHLSMTFIKIDPTKRFILFSLCLIIGSSSMMIFPIIQFIPLMIFMITMFGISASIMGTLIKSVMQISVPQNLRGKIAGFRMTIARGLSPISMVLAGILAQKISISIIISISFLISLLLSIIIISQSSVKQLLNYVPDN